MNVKIEKMVKYELKLNENGELVALRYGQPWRDFTGDKFVYCLGARIGELEQERAMMVEKLNSLSVSGIPIVSLDSTVSAYVNKITQTR